MPNASTDDSGFQALINHFAEQRDYCDAQISKLLEQESEWQSCLREYDEEQQGIQPIEEPAEQGPTRNH